MHFRRNVRSGAFVNRAAGTVGEMGKAVFSPGENNLAIYRVNPDTGEQTPVQHVNANGIHCRNIQFDRAGEILVSSHVKPFLL